MSYEVPEVLRALYDINLEVSFELISEWVSKPFLVKTLCYLSNYSHFTSHYFPH